MLHIFLKKIFQVKTATGIFRSGTEYLKWTEDFIMIKLCTLSC
jgi:hypothetical protein